ncbi:MAG: HPr family phosphocarrier protein [Lachnospiraceae bacterium]|nr:HPr family phosphocarrier protein [Lachnospiraceae bacterium]
MITKTMTINLQSGLEARPVALLVQIANQYESHIYVKSGTKKINAKSIMGMMSLGLAAGEEITIEADGEDEQKAVSHIEEYLSERKAG